MVSPSLTVERWIYRMKLAFISDIHGNANALDAVLNDINDREVDQVFVLGDLCYRGPEPNVINLRFQKM